MNRTNRRINPLTVDELEKGTTNYYPSSTSSTARMTEDVLKVKNRGDFTIMDWIQFMVIVLICLILGAILGIVIAVIVKIQYVLSQADGLFSPDSPIGSILRRLLSSE